MVAFNPTTYAIITGADPYSIASTSSIHAAAAVIILSEGRFGLCSLLGRVIAPPFRLSGEAGLDYWWRHQRAYHNDASRPTFEVWCKKELRGIADALDTVKLEGIQSDPFDVAYAARELAKEMRGELG